MQTPYLVRFLCTTVLAFEYSDVYNVMGVKTPVANGRHRGHGSSRHRGDDGHRRLVESR